MVVVAVVMVLLVLGVVYKLTLGKSGGSGHKLPEGERPGMGQPKTKGGQKAATGGMGGPKMGGPGMGRPAMGSPGMGAGQPEGAAAGTGAGEGTSGGGTGASSAQPTGDARADQ